MAKGIYVGVAGVARKVKKIYIGINGVARKVKKIYVGVAGVARLVYNPIIARVLNAPDLSVATDINPLAIVNSAYLIVYGKTDGFYQPEAYSPSLVKSATGLYASPYKTYVVGATNDDYAFVSHGLDSNGNYVKTINAVSKSLVVNTSLESTAGGWDPGPGQVGNFAIFLGGKINYGPEFSYFVDYINKSLVKNYVTMAARKGACPAAKVGNYAIFPGGEYQAAPYSTGATTDVTIYNDAMVRSSGAALPAGRSRMAAASVGNYAVFASGDDDDLTDMIVYNASLVQSVIPNGLSVARYHAGGVTMDDYAMFIGGSTKTVDLIDQSLVRSTIEQEDYILAWGNLLNTKRIGDYALICGGYVSANGTYLKAVQAYKQ